MGIREMSEMIYDSISFSELYQATIYCDIDYRFQKNLKDWYNVDTILKYKNEFPKGYDYEANFIGPDGKPISLGLAIHVASETLTPGPKINNSNSDNIDKNSNENNSVDKKSNGNDSEYKWSYEDDELPF